jgi:hypothetical protein
VGSAKLFSFIFRAETRSDVGLIAVYASIVGTADCATPEEEKEAVIMLTIHEAVENISGQKTAISNQWMKSKWYAGLIRALRNCQVHAEDFHYKNWGIRPSTGELVLLDLGF